MSHQELEEAINYPELARHHVYLHIATEEDFEVNLSNVYTVWFCYILGGWKALVSTTREDNRYYEVTFNEDKRETYLDIYIKSENHVLGKVK